MEIQKKLKRLSWVDLCRGLGIFFIVVGHIYTQPEINKPIYAFHVPLFFFLSGLVFESTKLNKKKLLNLVRKILLPYFLVGLISIIFFVYLGKSIFIFLGRDPANYLNVNLDGSFFEMILGMVFGNSKTGNMQWNLPLWFLPCYFVVLILAYLIEPLILKKDSVKRRIIGILFFSLIGIIYGLTIYDVYLPFQFETALRMIVWFEIGKLFKDEKIVDKIIGIIGTKRIILIGLILCLSGTIIAYNNGMVSVRLDSYSNIALYYLVASLDIMGILLICKVIENNKWLEYIGKRTLMILLLHKFPIVLSQIILKRLLQNNKISIVFITGIVVGILDIILCLIAEKILSNMKYKIIRKNV